MTDDQRERARALLAEWIAEDAQEPPQEPPVVPALQLADPTAIGEAGGRLRALVATLHEIEGLDFMRDDRGTRVPIAIRWNRALEVVREALKRDALLSAPVGSPPPLEVIVDAYQKAADLWSSQCFCFTSAPETVRRAAHEVALNGFNELVGILGPLARPVLAAEYRAADAEAREASAPRGGGETRPQDKP